MLKLKTNTRTELGKKTEALRQSGIIPVVLYGPGIKNINLSVDEREFQKIYREAGKSSLIELNIVGKKGKISCSYL